MRNTAKEAISYIVSLGSSLTFGSHTMDNMRLLKDGFNALAIAERLNNLVRGVAQLPNTVNLSERQQALLKPHKQVKACWQCSKLLEALSYSKQMMWSVLCAG